MGQRIKKGLKKAWEGITSNITASRKHEQEQEEGRRAADEKRRARERAERLGRYRRDYPGRIYPNRPRGSRSRPSSTTRSNGRGR